MGSKVLRALTGVQISIHAYTYAHVYIYIYEVMKYIYISLAPYVHLNIHQAPLRANHGSAIWPPRVENMSYHTIVFRRLQGGHPCGRHNPRIGPPCKASLTVGGPHSLIPKASLRVHDRSAAVVAEVQLLPVRLELPETRNPQRTKTSGEREGLF